LLKISQDTIERCRKTEYALVSSLQRDPILADRIKRLRTIPGVGPITALTWALEVGEVARFQSVKQAISYCGLCSAERSSADKLVRMPISKQRNKHIQQVLVEAAKLAPRYSHDSEARRQRKPAWKDKHQDYSVRRLPGLADDGLSDGGNSQGSHRFISGLAENTNSIFCADSSES
jgi:transposase